MNLEEKLKQFREKVKKYPLISITILIAVLLLLLIVVPYLQVDYRGINNSTQEAILENQYRATMAQIIGGGAVLLGLYFAWGNLITAREGQITERFTRAIDQLGSKELEIRLGGIYALERIANESDKDYWSIIEILTAYVRKNSNIKEFENSNHTISLDIQTILTILKKRKFCYKNGESESLDLRKTFLQGADLREANLQSAFFKEANLKRAKFFKANLEDACFFDTNCTEASFFKANLQGTIFAGAILQKANLDESNLEDAYLSNIDLREARLSDSILYGAILQGTNLENADLRWANLANTIFYKANLKDAELRGANLEKANLEDATLIGVNFDAANLQAADFQGANLKGAKNLTIDQLSKVKTLYKAKLDEVLEKPLREKYPALFDKPKYET